MNKFFEQNVIKNHIVYSSLLFEFKYVKGNIIKLYYYYPNKMTKYLFKVFIGKDIELNNNVLYIKNKFSVTIPQNIK